MELTSSYRLGREALARPIQIKTPARRQRAKENGYTAGAGGGFFSSSAFFGYCTPVWARLDLQPEPATSAPARPRVMTSARRYRGSTVGTMQRTRPPPHSLTPRSRRRAQPRLSLALTCPWPWRPSSLRRPCRSPCPPPWPCRPRPCPSSPWPRQRRAPCPC
jgi:hypothetical protein